MNVPNLEYENPVVDAATLRAIARESGGKAFDLSEINAIAPAFSIHKVARTLEDRQEIWDAPLIYGLVLISIILEWILRKKSQLV